MIELGQLVEMFDNARAYSWDMRGECVWDYFFTGSDRAALLKAGHVLESRGFELVGILDPNAEDDDQETLFLQVRRLEVHSPESLHSLNAEFYSFVEERGLTSYDGMQAGPARGD